MGLFDIFKRSKVKETAQDMADQHGDKIVSGVDKATDVVDDKTGGKYSDKLQQADDKARDVVDDLKKEGN
jgi:hypothetical protein